MAEFIDKGMILILCMLPAVEAGGESTPVMAFLLGLTAGALLYYLQERKQKAVLCMAFFVLCFLVPELVLFLPVIFYDCVRSRFYWGVAGIVPYMICSTAGRWGFGYDRAIDLSAYMTDHAGWGQTGIILWVIAAAVAVLLAVRTGKQQTLEREMIRLRDTSTELNMVLEEKNRTLIEQQDNEIYLATLKERNRIAREIHDNVGHMLSRSILQVGALLAIYKEETLHEQLASVNETLNQAMTNIRESVHDLHDDSVDLEQAMSEVLRPMRQKYQVRFDYDMGKAIPRNVKYCFLMAAKEAMSNIVKHSNANEITVTLREHPVLYQLKIEDNGTGKGTIVSQPQAEGIVLGSQGMGLANMKSRVENLNGTFRVSNEQGFLIFISIPKGEHCEK